MSNRQPHPNPIDIQFQNPRFPHFDFEMMSLSELKTRIVRFEDNTRIERFGFHILYFITSGHARLEVDFVPYDCPAASLLNIRPSQMLKYLDLNHAQGYVLLFTKDSIYTATETFEQDLDLDVFRLDSPTLFTLYPQQHEYLAGLFKVLEYEYEHGMGTTRSARIMRHLLWGLIYKLQRIDQRVDSPDIPPTQLLLFREFQSLLEQKFRSHRKVSDYALALGYSSKSLNRAVQSINGQQAKYFIDQRVILEARRLLAYTDWRISEVGFYLGFSETTNFVKFFQKYTKLSPRTFKLQYRKA